MHQTFYIDIDEEITSIIERLKKAQTREIIMVVPKRALLIQSIVNLRILKKEADKIGLQLMVITQDKLGKILIEKAGILVQQKMDNIADEEIDLNERSDESKKDLQGNNKKIDEVVEADGHLDHIGTNNYFSEEEFIKQTNKKVAKTKKKKATLPIEKEKIINRELVLNSQKELRKNRQSNIDINTNPKNEVSLKKVTKKEENYKVNNEKLENFFKSSKKKNKLVKKEEEQDYKISSKTRRLFFIFGTFFLLVMGAIGGYLFIPKVKINIISKVKYKDINSEIIGKTDVHSINKKEEIIPAQRIEITPEIKKNYPATGEKTVSNQKAKGIITIYNKYSTQPQPLVATTRFMSENGKLFRLVKGLTIPGTTVENGQIKPGSIEAQIVADEAGSDFNIQPTKFTIPGFKSTPSKYSQFYAQSEKAMSGGGDGKQKVHIITQEDIDKAKKQALTSLNSSLKQKIKEEAKENVILLDDAIDKKEATYKLSNSLNEIVDSFQLTISMKVTAIVVQESEFKNIVAQMLSQAGDGQISMKDDSIKIDFGKANVDFEKGTIDMRFQAKGKIKPNIDIAKIKKAILGKNESVVKTYLKSSYPDIDEIDMEYWPSFIQGRIPFQEKRVEITLDK